MGSPVSVVIAEILMQNIEEIIVSKLDNSFKFWFRYADDIITCVQTINAETIFQKINAIHTDIHFSLEREENKIVNFLDIKSMRIDSGILHFSIFRRPTHTN